MKTGQQGTDIAATSAQVSIDQKIKALNYRSLILSCLVNMNDTSRYRKKIMDIAESEQHHRTFREQQS